MTQHSRSGKEHLLRDIVTALVSAWGKDEVAKMLAIVGGATSSSAEVAAVDSDRKAGPSRKKTSAMDYVARVHAPTARRELLKEVAQKFDHKAFLPTLPDVVQFLRVQGVDASHLKHRPEAFRQVLDSLIDMPDERLKTLARSSSYGGPARLGPLSDAIRSVSQTLRSGIGEASDSTKQSDDNPGRTQKDQ